MVITKPFKSFHKNGAIVLACRQVAKVFQVLHCQIVAFGLPRGHEHCHGRPGIFSFSFQGIQILFAGNSRVSVAVCLLQVSFALALLQSLCPVRLGGSQKFARSSRFQTAYSCICCCVSRRSAV